MSAAEDLGVWTESGGDSGILKVVRPECCVTGIGFILLSSFFWRLDKVEETAQGAHTEILFSCRVSSDAVLLFDLIL